ncbi:Uncharacterized protein APZ42_003061, partial [Daphnia magna]
VFAVLEPDEIVAAIAAQVVDVAQGPAGTGMDTVEGGPDMGRGRRRHDAELVRVVIDPDQPVAAAVEAADAGKLPIRVRQRDRREGQGDAVADDGLGAVAVRPDHVVGAVAIDVDDLSDGESRARCTDPVGGTGRHAIDLRPGRTAERAVPPQQVVV